MKNLTLIIWIILFSTLCITKVSAEEITALEMSRATAFPADELTDILDRGVLRVAMYKRDTPPFYYKDQHGQLSGVDVELIKGFARKLGVDVEFNRSANTINETVTMVANGEADIAISKLSITFERATKVLFTTPYIKLRKGLIVNRVLLERQIGERSKREAIQSLKGTIGIIGKSAYVTYAKQRFSHMAIRPYNSWAEVIEAVVNREIIAGFRDEAEIKKVTLDNKNYSMELLTVVLEDDYDPKGIAVPSNAHYLKSLLEFYIETLGLELNANNVLFDYDNVISHINRFELYQVNNTSGESP